MKREPGAIQTKHAILSPTDTRRRETDAERGERGGVERSSNERPTMSIPGVSTGDVFRMTTNELDAYTEGVAALAIRELEDASSGAPIPYYELVGRLATKYLAEPHSLSLGLDLAAEANLIAIKPTEDSRLEQVVSLSEHSQAA